jgi:prepilin-type N-terminal cleavage/methylation domain-containing protein
MIRWLPQKWRDTRGFTLPEVLVVLCLLSILLPFLLRCFFTIAEQQKQRTALGELEDNLLIAAETLTGDIAGSTAVLSCEENQLVLQKKTVIYYTLGTDEQAKEHFYPLEGKILYRRESSQWNRQPMANFLETLTFFYLDDQGQPTLEAAAVRAVGFCITGLWQEQRLERTQIIRLAGNDYL